MRILSLVPKPLRKYINRETIAYLVCGLLSMVVGLGSFALAVQWGSATAAANTISTVLAVLFAFATNKIFVFQSKKWALKPLLFEAAKFSGARFVTFVLETALLVLLVDVLGFHSVIMKAFTLVLVVLGNYLLSKFFVFKQ